MLRVSFFIGLLFISYSTHAFDLYLLRHFEKQSQSQSDNPRLTQTGEQRASNLATILETAEIKRIYSTSYNRTLDSVAPLAQIKQLNVESYDPRDLESFSALLLSRAENAVVSGHSNTTPALLLLLGGPEIKIHEQDYGTLYIVSIENERVTVTTVEVSNK